MSRSDVVRLLNNYRQIGSIRRQPVAGHPTKITFEVLQIVVEQMQLDDESIAIQLQKLLVDKEHLLSLQTIKSRSKLGWTFRGSAYYQLIREAMKVKRLEWAQKYLQTAL